MSSTQEKRCRTCAHWGLDMICQNEDSGYQGYTCMPGAACGHWEGTGEPEVRHGRWISAEDALPDALQSVLVCTDINTVTVAWINGDGWTFADTGNGHTENCPSEDVKFWMPLPEPPKDADSVMMGDRR